MDKRYRTRRAQPCLAVTVAALLAAGCASSRAVDNATWDFEGEPLGHFPADWMITQTNPTTSLARWEVIADDSAPSGANVLALTVTENYDGTYNLAVARQPSFQDLDLSVQVKAVAGREDQGGGPIWRCRDRNNYYICRLNPLEGNFRVYVVKQGRRKQLDSAQVRLVADRWYTIRVVMTGDEITCWLDGRPLLHAFDLAIVEPGRVGLWTKADAVTSFDGLTVRPADPG